MLSKTSFFNKTLFRKNLTRFWPLWGMVSFIGALLPAAMLLNLGYSHIDGYEITYLYYNALVYVLPGVSLVYAIICAVACWEYLFFPRNLSMMHTLPIRREGIFVTNFLSGMAMMLIPYVVTGVMCVIVSLMLGCFEPIGLLETIAGVLGLSLFYFCSATFVAFLTGNIFMLPALYFLLHFLAPLMDALCSILAGGFIYGLNSNYSGAVNFLSPTVYIIQKMHIETLGHMIPDPDYPGSTYYQITGYDLQGLWIIGVYALVGLVLLALAWALYRRRRSECAGDVIAVGWMKPIFRFGISALAAMGGGLVLYYLLWHGIHNRPLMAAAPLACFMIVAGAIGYYAASMMLTKSLRVFRGSWRGMSIVAVFSILLCFSLSTDVFGVGTRVPDADDIRELTFRAAGNTYIFYGGDDDEELLEQVLDLHAAIANDTDYIVDFLDWDNGEVRETLPDGSIRITYNGISSEDISTYNTVRFTYELEDGTRLDRRYSVHITRDRLNQPDTYDAKLDALVNSVEMRCKRLLMDQPEYEPYGGNVWLDFGENNDFGLSDREAVVLLEAVRKDALTAAWGEYEWFDNGYDTRYAMSIDLNLRYEQPETGNGYHENLHIYVRPGMEHTIACLIELGIVASEEDMMTYSEMDFQHFAAIVEEVTGKAPHELSMDALQMYCLEYGYDFEIIVRHLYGEDVLTSFPATSVGSEAAEALAEINMNPNSSAIYIS